MGLYACQQGSGPRAIILKLRLSSKKPQTALVIERALWLLRIII